MQLLAALWLAFAGPLFPDLPPLQIVYLGPSATTAPDRPDGIAGLVASPPERAVAILFKGSFDFGGTDALTTALDAAPKATLVAFDSPGGRPMVADGVAGVIRSRHLDTTVAKYCASACTIAYLAGTLRTAEPGALFGFHLGTGVVLADLAAKVVLQLERRAFVRGGASLSFAERALHAPNPAPYFPSMAELLAAGYVHRALGHAPASVAPADPLVAAVEAIEPQTGLALRTGQTAMVHAGRTPERARAIADQWAVLVADRWFARSSEQAALAFVDAELSAFGWFAEHDAMSCMRWQIARTDQDLAVTLLPDEVRGALQSAEIAVLTDANTYPVPVPVDDGALSAADNAVRRQVAAAYGSHALANAASAEHGFDDPALSCAAQTAYLRGLRGHPAGGRLLRWALAAG